jgi:hypothetical protein
MDIKGYNRAGYFIYWFVAFSHIESRFIFFESPLIFFLSLLLHNIGGFFEIGGNDDFLCWSFERFPLETFDNT